MSKAAHHSCGSCGCRRGLSCDSVKGAQRPRRRLRRDSSAGAETPEGLEYRPAGSGSVRTRELSRSIEVVVPRTKNPYIITVLDGITSSAPAEGFEVVIGRIPVPPGSTLKRCSNPIIPAQSSLPRMPPVRRQGLGRAGFPVVVVDPLRLAIAGAAASVRPTSPAASLLPNTCCPSGIGVLAHAGARIRWIAAMLG